MKKIILFVTILLAFSCCKDDDDTPTNPIDQLPPATQTGANTFGCLLDGEVFLPRGGINPLDCVYQLVDGGYYFSLQGNKRNEDQNLILLGLSTNDLQIFENKTYNLEEKEPANAYGTYAFAASFSYTNNVHSGELTITKLDYDTSIVSGTFWYDIEDQNGVIHQIREGRFDMRFTQ